MANSAAGCLRTQLDAPEIQGDGTGDRPPEIHALASVTVRNGIENVRPGLTAASWASLHRSAGPAMMRNLGCGDETGGLNVKPNV